MGKAEFKRVTPRKLRCIGTDMARFCRCILKSLQDAEGELPFVLTNNQRAAGEELRLQCTLDLDDLEAITEKAVEMCYTMMSETHPSVLVDIINCPIHRFRMLLCWRSNNVWVHARQVPPLLAQSQYWKRLVIYARMLKTADERGGIMKFVIILACNLYRLILTRESALAFSACNFEHRFLIEDHVNAFSIERGLMHLTSHYAYSDPTTPRFTLEDDGKAFTVDGDFITLDSLRKWAALRISELRELVYSKLFFGQDLSVSKTAKAEDGAWVKDDLVNAREGYSFVTDKHNPFCQKKYSLAQYVMNDPKLQKIFCTRRDGQTYWKKGPVLDYLADCAKAWAQLSTCMQFGGGLPQRGSEVAASKLCNTHHRVRSAYMIHRKFTSAGFYSKKTHNQLCDDILLRFYIEELSDVAIDMSTILRSFEIILAKAVYTDEEVLCYKQSLFVGMGKALTSQQLSDDFAESTMDGFDVRISFSLWRHIAEFLRQKHCRVLRWLHSPSENAGIHLEKAGVYHAQEIKHIQDLTNSKLEACQYMSEEWHWFLRLGPAPQQTVPSGLDHFLGDDAVDALASLSSSQEILLTEISTLQKELDKLESTVQKTENGNADLQKLLNRFKQSN